jgi:hypothetical protein
LDKAAVFIQPHPLPWPGRLIPLSLPSLLSFFVARVAASTQIRADFSRKTILIVQKRLTLFFSMGLRMSYPSG